MELRNLDVMLFVLLGFISGALSYTTYSYVWRLRRGERFSWLQLASMLLSVLIDVAVSPLLTVPGAVPLVLRGLSPAYVLLSSFTFGIMANFLVALPLNYYIAKAESAVRRVMRGSTATLGFWGRRTADVSRLQQPVTRKFRRLWLIVIAIVILIPASFVFASLQYQATISTTGNIKAVGVAFYVDSAGSTAISTINWGILSPGQNVNVTLYCKSTSNVPVTLSMAVGNFNPASGGTYLACTWNYNGSTLSVGAMIPIVFTLQVASTITGISTFSFDIGVISTG
jgi:hypothetical protein